MGVPAILEDEEEKDFLCLMVGCKKIFDRKRTINKDLFCVEYF